MKGGVGPQVAWHSAWRFVGVHVCSACVVRTPGRAILHALLARARERSLIRGMCYMLPPQAAPEMQRVSSNATSFMVTQVRGCSRSQASRTQKIKKSNRKKHDEGSTPRCISASGTCCVWAIVLPVCFSGFAMAELAVVRSLRKERGAAHLTKGAWCSTW